MAIELNDLSKIKTVDEYILHELKKYIFLYENKCNEVSELEFKLQKISVKEPQEEKNYIYLTNTPYYYYRVEIDGAYVWNEYLLQNKKDPSFVEKALIDDETFNQFCNLTHKDRWRGKLAEVDERKYDYLFKDRKGRRYVLILNEDDVDIYPIDNNKPYFLTLDEANEYLKNNLKEDIEYYIKNYKNKYKEKD